MARRMTRGRGQPEVDLLPDDGDEPEAGGAAGAGVDPPLDAGDAGAVGAAGVAGVLPAAGAGVEVESAALVSAATGELDVADGRESVL